ncbi:MAG: radical SAM protein [Candidatus Marinimicrobia bacterium]|jgi:radical SAM protein with 4Fe4S-binding SPASM domain|nr:radical SAM protein [Candidatus Neomarinimicrobiota bacterium]
MTNTVSFIQKARSYEKDRPRVKLADKLPLTMPFSIQIDPSNLCNFKCRFCPTGHPDLIKQVGRSRGRLMSWALYEKLINEISIFPEPLKILSLHKDGEPLVNPRIVDMVDLARRKQVADRVGILTNAALLDREMSIGLIEAGLDVIRISVEHVTREGYQNITGKFSDYEKIVRNVAVLKEEAERRNSQLYIVTKLIDLGLSKVELEKFEQDFSASCHEIGRTTVQGWSLSEIYDFTLGTNPQFSLDGKTALKTGRITCPYPFYTLAVNADGAVSPCSDDWSHKAAVGDSNTETLQEIWSGRRMHDFRMMHLTDERHCNDACRNCHCLQGVAEDSDLDFDRERLISIFGSR